MSEKQNKTKTSKFIRVPWSENGKNITTEYFKKHILLKKAPQKEECEELKKNIHN